MLTLIAIALTLSLSLLYFLFIVKGRRSDDPPTLGWLPVVGSLPYLTNCIEEQMSDSRLGKEPVVLLHFGLERMYCLNTFAAVHQALIQQGDKFLSRPFPVGAKMLTGEAGGIVMASGEQWSKYRRFALKTLRDLGFGRQGSEQIIRNEVQFMLEFIDSHAAGASVDTSAMLASSISNVICQLVFGARLGSEPEFQKVSELMKMVIRSQNSRNKNFVALLLSQYFTSFPFVLNLLNLRRKPLIEAFQGLIDFCKKQADQHRADMQEGSEPRDFIDAHLLHQNNSEGFNDARLTLSIVDLFVAGTDTTSHTLRWAILFIIANPRVEQLLLKEINSCVGAERLVSMKDKADMHYTLATLEEVHRCASLASTGVPHVSTEEAVVSGYTIPAGSAVMYNVYNIHNSAELFPNPERFEPERHLNLEGRFSPNPHVVAFGVGKRACLGESLARMELFIFLVTLVQIYKFSIDPNDTRTAQEMMQNCNTGSGLRAPQDHSIVFTRRR